ALLAEYSNLGERINFNLLSAASISMVCINLAEDWTVPKRMYPTRRIRPIRKNGNAYQKPYRMLSMIPPPMHSTTRANLRYIFIDNMYFAFAAKIVEIYFIVKLNLSRFRD